MIRLATAIAAVMLTAVPVLAADLPARMPVKAPAPVVAPVFSWTGCYVGIHGGYGWGSKKWSDDVREFTSHDVDGWLVGGQVGCQIQQDRWVFGIEGQASWADIDGSSTDGAPAGPHSDWHSKADILGTIALRLGYSVDRTLFYVKGGLAFARDKHSEEGFFGTQLVSINDGDKYLRWGWMVGGGLEYAFTGNWSGKIEYNFMDLGREDVQFCQAIPPGPACFDYSIKQHIHVVKVGINYRFGGFGGPVVARY